VAFLEPQFQQRLARAHPSGSDVFLMAVTGWGQAKDRHESQAAGFNYHLTKPLFRKRNGRVNQGFSGRLSFSWPRDTTQTAINRHDTNMAPLFPYGFGLTC
jgi:CheY-like chemotaxis protein